jgi:hypothetical protein
MPPIAFGIQPRLRTLGAVEIQHRDRRRRRQPELLRAPAEPAERLDHVVDRDVAFEPDRHGLGMPVHHRHAVGVGAHDDGMRGVHGAEDLLRLALDLLFLPGDAGDYVAQNVQRRHPRIPAPDTACIVVTTTRDRAGGAAPGPS